MISFFRVISMPRKAREKSSTNIYHVMLRGVNKQVIFENDGDRNFFLKVMKTCKEASGFKLHAFCLMSNHVHLLMEPGEEPLETVFRRVGSRYVKWYNEKYERVGNLFQDRFRSENVETQQYFMTVLRYILWNPVKAGMVSSPGQYRWSSYRAYERGEGSLTDTAFAESVFGSRENLIAFCSQDSDDTAMDDDDRIWRMKDDEAIGIMSRITGCASVSEFQQTDPGLRKAYAQEMYLEKLSVNQISRITGMSRKTVTSAVQRIDPVLLDERNALQFHETEETGFGFDPSSDEVW